MSIGSPGGTREPGRRVWARVTTYWPVLLVLLVVLGALQQVMTEHWRVGSSLLGVAALVAAGLRLLLPADRVGLLAIRGRTADALCYSGFGFAVLVLALTITRGSLAVN